ncbi:hypothetical protein SRB5_05050 [Streptomyces sp. RB5]|uniref:S1 motif domain-containing protein n=1 Tax=Streptomyces smaragdinus TaxID=2585196 RepID=A0A7K0CAB2_9ACTN|nr:S1 RNA-binding domain-containing protein [Streptomyces smaragdinus]MQY10397.1 hypothetical protein [Streptomyces smaragdinus]
MILRVGTGHGTTFAREETVEACAALVGGIAERAGVTEVTVDNPMLDGFFGYTSEPWRPHLPADLHGFHDGARVPLATGLTFLRVMLRRLGPWCRLRAEGFLVHVGDRYDVYVTGTERDEARARELGLFPVRVDRSPYDPALDTVPEQRPADEAFWTETADLVARRGPLLLEEEYVRNGRRWHPLATPTDVTEVRARLGPRARLALWPGLTEDREELRAAMRRHPEPQQLVWVRRGRCEGIRLAEEWMLDDRDRYPMIPGPAAVVPLVAEERTPMLAATLPDADGVLRARWRTDATRADERRAYLRTLERGDIVTGVVATGLDDVGVHVDLDHPLGANAGFLRVPEMSWEHWDSLDDVAPIGRAIRAQVIHVDFEFERASLSVKALQPGPTRSP